MSYTPIVILTGHFYYKKVLFGTKNLSYKVIVISSGVMLSGEPCIRNFVTNKEEQKVT